MAHNCKHHLCVAAFLLLSLVLALLLFLESEQASEKARVQDKGEREHKGLGENMQQ